MNAAIDRYADTNALWGSLTAPAITRAEAERAARALFRKFGRKTGYPRQRANAKLRDVRRCWLSSKPGCAMNRGWARLVHDVSHQIFRARHPSLRPHNPMHSRLEFEITAYVLQETDWLRGGLRPTAPDASELRAAKLAKVDAAIERWGAKLRRAQRAIAKLKRRRSALVRRAS